MQHAKRIMFEEIVPARQNVRKTKPSFVCNDDWFANCP